VVEADESGFIYIVDRANTGMHILELTGAARAIIGNWGGGERRCCDSMLLRC